MLKHDLTEAQYGPFAFTTFEDWHECGDEVPDGETNMFTVVARLGEVVAGSAEFIFRNGRLLPNNTEVAPEFQRQGLATAMYVFAERHGGSKVRPHDIQTPDGKALWDQPGRPFGY